jgi:hypothetical protein
MRLKFSIFLLYLSTVLLTSNLSRGASRQPQATRASLQEQITIQMDKGGQGQKASDKNSEKSIIGLEADFSQGVLPEGWQINELGDPGFSWGFQGDMIWIISYYYEENHVAGELISPAIDCSEMDLVLLEMDQNYFFYPFPAGMTDAEIRYSTDGENWNTFYTFTQSQGGYGEPLFELDLTEVAAGESEFYLKFWFDDQDHLRAYWQIYSLTVYNPTIPEIQIQPDLSTWDFGTVLLEESSQSQSITVKNVGNGSLMVQAPQLSDETHFSLIYNEADFPAALEFQDSISFEMVFHPQIGGSLQAEMSFIYGEGAEEQYTATLTGMGYDPTITSFPWTEHFNQFEFPALGWRYVQGVEGAYWQGSGVESYPDGRSVRSYFGPSSNYQANEWLLTPPLDLDHPEAELMYFFVASNFPADSVSNKLQVWVLPERYDNVEDLEANGEMIAEFYVDEPWERKSVDIRNYDGIKYFAFRYYVNMTGGWRLVYLDNLNIEELQSHTLTMLEPVGGGNVVPASGTHEYFAGEQVSLKADTELSWGWAFEKWELNGTFYDDQPEITFTIEEDTEVQAFFTPVSPITLEMLAADGEGITLPAVGEYAYKEESILSVMAYPADGWVFSHWKKDGVQYATENPLLVAMVEDLNLQAVFEEGSGYSITFNVQDSQGSPVTQAQIRLNDIQNPAGDYSFEGLLTGTYRYSVLAEGFKPGGGELNLSNQNITHTISLEQGYGAAHSITFEVSDEEGNAIDDAVIIINGFAGLTGSYTFDAFPNGTYAFLVIRSDYRPYEGELEVAGSNQNIQVQMTEDDRLFWEDFANNTQPGGWSIVIHGQDNRKWEFAEGAAAIQPNQDFFVSASLVSPAIDVSEAIALSLKMDHFYNPYTRTTGEIRISEDGMNWHRAKVFRDDAQGDIFMEEVDYYLTEDLEIGDKIFFSFTYSALNSLNSYFNWKIDEIELYKPSPFAFEATRASEHLYLEEGEAGAFKLRIRNIGGLPDIYTLEKIHGTYEYEFDETVELVGGNQSVINISFEMPEGLNMGTRDTLIIRVASQSEPQLVQELTFINAAIATIKEDYKEDFDIVTLPNLPGGWSKIRNSTSLNANVATNASDPFSQPNLVRMNNATDIEAELVLISPPLSDERSLSEFRTRLWLRNSANSPLIVGTMDHPEGTFTPLKEWVSQNHFTWQEFMLGFEGYEGTDKYVAFKQKNVLTNQAVHMDDIILEIIPPPIFQISMESHDFGEGWVNYTNDSLEVTITNIGHYEVLVEEIYLEVDNDFYLQLPELPELPASLAYNEVLSFKVYFHPQKLGEINDRILINYTEETQSVFSFELSGEALPRPQGSTCEDPIPVELPIVDYAGNTEQYGNDYFTMDIAPGNYFLEGNDMVMQFTLNEASVLSGGIEGDNASFFVLSSCPNPSDPAPVLAMALDYPGYESFQNIIIDPGTYFLVVSSAQFKPPFYTDFVFNLSAEPLPEYQLVNFLVTEDSDEEEPLEGVRLYIEGELMSGNIYSGANGRVSTNMLEGEYSAKAFLFGYLEEEISFEVNGEADIHIRLEDLMFYPTGLEVDTENQAPGQALLRWDALPQGEPWIQGFEGTFVPEGWDQIINNPDGLTPEEDGADWQFTWQQYGTVQFSDDSVVPVEGQKQAFIHWSPMPQDEWLITHQFKAPADVLEFWYYGRNGDNKQAFYVKISTDNGQTWSPIWNASDLSFGVNHYDYPVQIDLSYYADQNIRLAWNAVGPNGLISAFLLDAIRVGNTKIDTEDLIVISNSRQGADSNGSPLVVYPGPTASTRDLRYVPRVKEEDLFIPKNNRASKTFGSYEVFLNDLSVPIAVDLQETQYLYMYLSEGNYLAGVRSVYTTGESEIITKDFTITVGDDGSQVEEMEQFLKVFPNPASKWLNMESTQFIDSYRLINSRGEVVASQKIDAYSARIDVSYLSGGVYFLQAFSGKNQIYQVIEILR